MKINKKLSDQLYTDNWPRRRKWMLTVLVWALANAQYVMIWGDDTGLHQNALVALLGLIAAIIGSYVFGAVWDDNDKRRRCAHQQEGEE